MNIDELDNIIYLEEGDIITIDKKRYYCKTKSSDFDNCVGCAFRENPKCPYKTKIYDCAANWVQLIPVEKEIENIEKEINYLQNKIEKLKK